jgi:hypothetical protein
MKRIYLVISFFRYCDSAMSGEKQQVASLKVKCRKSRRSCHHAASISWQIASNTPVCCKVLNKFK